MPRERLGRQGAQRQAWHLREAPDHCPEASASKSINPHPPWREGPAPFLKISQQLSPATMDLRLILVAAPILLAASWAVFHIGRAAVGQLQLFIKRA